MEFKGLRVLVLDAAGKQTLAMVRGLKEIGCFVAVLCKSKLDTCYMSNLPDQIIMNPQMAVINDKYIQELLNIVSSGKYDVLMPVGELSTNLVTKHEDEFNKHVKIACAPREVYIKAFNKQVTFDTAMENSIPCPYTRSSKQDIEDFLEHAHFPIIIKPRQGLGSIGFHKFETEDEFRRRLADTSFDIDDYIIQEFVDFENRIGTNLFIDQKGNICTSYAVDVLRWFPIDAGAGVLMVTVDVPEILRYAGDLLKALKWRGFANIAFMIDKKTGQPKLLEINGRIPASVKVAYMCGYNVSRQLLEMVYDQNVIQYPENNQFGMYVRHLDTDIIWFLKSPDRFKAQPSWFSWKNTKEILYSKDDRKPFFANFIQKTFRYKTIMKKKQH